MQAQSLKVRQFPALLEEECGATHNIHQLLTSPDDIGFRMIHRKRAYRIVPKKTLKQLYDPVVLYRKIKNNFQNIKCSIATLLAAQSRKKRKREIAGLIASKCQCQGNKCDCTLSSTLTPGQKTRLQQYIRRFRNMKTIQEHSRRRLYCHIQSALDETSMH